MFSTSSTPPASPSDFKQAYNNSSVDHHHVEKVHVLSTQRKALSSAQKERDNKEIKQPRHAFHTRSQVDVLDDGYQWRKYRKKIVKSNKFPRSYYRCSHQGCNVKRQIQRHSEDEQIVVTTYEGIHTHPVEKSSENSFEQILGKLLISNLLSIPGPKLS